MSAIHLDMQIMCPQADIGQDARQQVFSPSG